MKKVQAGIMVSLFILWLFAMLWLFGLTACSVDPDCSIVDCTLCWDARWEMIDGRLQLVYYSCEPEDCIVDGWIYDPILNRWYHITRDCNEE